MTEEAVIRFVSNLPGVTTVTAGEANGAPEVAWGDTFFFYAPEPATPSDQKFPFATIVTKDYEGFDTASNLNRPGVFRVNIAVGRTTYQEVCGHPPAAHAEHHADYDYSALDQLVPHPVYAVQGWVCIVNPGDATSEQMRSLLTEAHARAAQRSRRRAGAPGTGG
jgi:hypothetical protein